MTTATTQSDWLSPDEVAAALRVSRRSIDSMLIAEPPRIPDEYLRRIGQAANPKDRKAIRIHRSYVDPSVPGPNAKVIGFPQPPVDEAALARAFVDELIALLLSGEVARRAS